MKGVLPVATISSVCATVLFLTVIAHIFHDINELYSNAMVQMEEFRVTADDTWHEITYVNLNPYGAVHTTPSILDFVLRTKRQQTQCKLPSDCGPSPTKCPQGPEGPRGKPGEKGADGVPGEDGMPGPPGVVLLATYEIPGGCIECPPGNEGPPGLDGPVGPAGAKGLPGVPGKNGKVGQKGPPGPKGKVGQIGPDGPKGKPGRDGKNGKRGTGPQGKKGPPGQRGPEGPKGADGKDGEPGPQGESGPDGKPGADGRDGKDGKPGAPGITGSPGEDALYCPCPPRAQKVSSTTTHPVEPQKDEVPQNGSGQEKSAKGTTPLTPYF